MTRIKRQAKRNIRAAGKAAIALLPRMRCHTKRAHESAQQDEGPEGSWVHAYLHRKEGDQDNAAYWYRRAGKPVCRESLDAERQSIVKDLVR
jgi:hypothetical protein